MINFVSDFLDTIAKWKENDGTQVGDDKKGKKAHHNKSVLCPLNLSYFLNDTKVRYSGFIIILLQNRIT